MQLQMWNIFHSIVWYHFLMAKHCIVPLKRVFWYYMRTGTWVHEYMIPVHEYMSTRMITWVHEYTYAYMSTWIHEYMSAWVHEYMSANTHVYMEGKGGVGLLGLTSVYRTRNSAHASFNCERGCWKCTPRRTDMWCIRCDMITYVTLLIHIPDIIMGICDKS